VSRLALRRLHQGPRQTVWLRLPLSLPTPVSFDDNSSNQILGPPSSRRSAKLTTNQPPQRFRLEQPLRPQQLHRGHEGACRGPVQERLEASGRIKGIPAAQVGLQRLGEGVRFRGQEVLQEQGSTWRRRPVIGFSGGVGLLWVERSAVGTDRAYLSFFCLSRSKPSFCKGQDELVRYVC
jgi:hypothetical protein